jgi:hypothetical protein
LDIRGSPLSRVAGVLLGLGVVVPVMVSPWFLFKFSVFASSRFCLVGKSVVN